MFLEVIFRNIYSSFFKGTPRKRLKYYLERSSALETVIYNQEAAIYELRLKKFKGSFYIRNRPSSDFDVLKQILIENEYALACSAFEQNFSKSTAMNIIDAGANIGLTALYFSNRFPQSTITAIEPDASNFLMLKMNCAKNKNISPLNNALSAQAGKIFKVESSRRDGSDWSKTTQESKTGNIKGITLNELVETNSGFFDILKIDIEGAERFLFDKDADVSFLNKTKVLVMEIHDEYNIRASVYKILKDYNFIILEHSELTVAINTTILGSKT